jgi:hypothetical protein
MVMSRRYDTHESVHRTIRFWEILTHDSPCGFSPHRFHVLHPQKWLAAACVHLHHAGQQEGLDRADHGPGAAIHFREQDCIQVPQNRGFACALKKSKTGGYQPCSDQFVACFTIKLCRINVKLMLKTDPLPVMIV